MTKEIKTPIARWTGICQIHEAGGFVAYGDYLTLQRALAQVTAELEKARERAQVVAANMLRLKDETDEMSRRAITAEASLGLAKIEQEKEYVRAETAERKVEDVKCSLLRNPQEEFDIGIEVDKLRGQKESAESRIKELEAKLQSAETIIQGAFK